LIDIYPVREKMCPFEIPYLCQELERRAGIAKSRKFMLEFHSCSVKVKLSASLKKQAQISVRQVADKILPACLMRNDFLREING
jgi:hypothetical protein